MREAALALAKGSYQRDLIYGHETWSGSSLKGKARTWSSKYRQSRRALLERLTAAGVGYLTIGKRGKIEFNLGRPGHYYIPTFCACGEAWLPGEPTVLDLIVEATS